MPAKGSSRKGLIAEILALSGVFLLLLGSALFFALRPKGKADYADVLLRGEWIHRLSLKEEKELGVSVPDGEIRIRVKDEAIAVVSSPCPSHYCVHVGPKSNAGESIVCAPEGLAIYLRALGEATEVVL